MKRRVEIGILYSRSGNYRLVSEACHRGTMQAVAAVNADPFSPIEFIPVERDPEGNADRYATLAEDILRNSGARHIIGGVTSWSRKEIIPALEKAGGTLWYACPYEGFEANEHVVYMHACPNQHLVPLLGHVIPLYGPNGFLTGSNYIWGWETNRVARDLIADASGSVLGERYLPLGETDVARLIHEIRAIRPNFILNNLIGPSSYAFFQAYAELSRQDDHFTPEHCPIISCNLTECELPAIGSAGNGHLSAGPYFHDASAKEVWLVGQPENGGSRPSSFQASAYASVKILACILAAGGDASPSELSAAFASSSFNTPFGTINIDPQTQHATLPVQIGRIVDNGFEKVSITRAVDPDPYLSRYDRSKVFGRRRLKVVS
ncbi:transporter substrate-binding protein [Mesorhizobium retamae]|uniref:Transporter substrate-binding protein n=1 Tax=Mesorhizobium retamae TaxID=2912854 RepID=A0ABS9Q7W6_9HYPH|nr:transporter substrate-binding protein [Mesorhizobium sp. IRAMC:0171]